MSTISTHVLDTARGRPAEGLALRLERRDGEDWVGIGGGVTDNDGRVRTLVDASAGLSVGIYRMSFETGAWFQAQRLEGFSPIVQVVFEIMSPDAHFHVPLLLSPFGYSTYRGS